MTKRNSAPAQEELKAQTEPEIVQPEATPARIKKPVGPDTADGAPAQPRLETGTSSPLRLGGIDLNALRLSQDYIEAAAVTKLRTTVPVRKPNKTEFLQVHPDHHFDLYMVELKDENEIYFVLSEFLVDVVDIAVPVSLRLAVNRQGVTFLWPVRLPVSDRRDNPWHISARDAVARAASGRWVSIRANKILGAYEIYEGAPNLSPPQWPQEPFKQILQIPLRGHVIDKRDHPVLRSLRGEM